ncbi:MAG: lipid-binding SYLF domain-containing protein [Terriglobales bacterium]
MRKLILFVALLSLASLCWGESSLESSNDRLDNSAKALREIMAAPDKGIPEEVLEHAKCIAVVPHMINGGFVFGAENGRGVATCRTADGWSAPAFFAITGGSWGLQFGIEGVDLVMIIQNDKGMQRLLSSHFELGAGASVAAGPVGRHATADTDWKLDTEVLTYSRAKGIFAGMALTGASVRRDDKAMDAVYGHDVTNRSVLLGEKTSPAAADGFLNVVKGAKAQAIAKASDE